MNKKMKVLLFVAFMMVLCVSCGEKEDLQKNLSDFRSYLREEDFYEYEIKTDKAGGKYAVINGFRGECNEEFAAGLKKKTGQYYYLLFPETLEGAAVKELAAGAFQNMDLRSCWGSVKLSSNIITIGDSCFENCGLETVTCNNKGPLQEEGAQEAKENMALTVGDRAFAGNPGLWGVYFNRSEIDFGREVFAGCGEKMYLCYRAEPGEEGRFTEYALKNRLEVVEIPAFYSDKPIVRYQETPLILTPCVKNFFYGDSADDDHFCSFEYDDDAPDYGFPEWHIPCGEFCAMASGRLEYTASSELSSTDGRYSAENLSSWGRERTWAEGVDGYGAGESISLTNCCSYRNSWDGEVSFLEGDIEPDICDVYMRYTKICIVNGYARNQKTWEENGRVKRLLMYVEDKPYAYLELEDTIRPQYFTLPINDIKAAEGVDIHFKFVIEDVYPGIKYEDTCLTGLEAEFMGRRGH